MDFLMRLLPGRRPRRDGGEVPQSPEARAQVERAEKRKRRAHLLVRRYTALSVPGCFIPIPLVDTVTITALQMAMLAQIAKVYEVPYARSKARLITISLLLGIPQALSTGFTWGIFAVFPMAKLLPGAGPLVTGAFMAAYNVSVTYALGVIFIEHFESGGTFLNFHPEEKREAFRREVARQLSQRRSLWRRPFRSDHDHPAANPALPWLRRRTGASR